MPLSAMANSRVGPGTRGGVTVGTKGRDVPYFDGSKLTLDESFLRVKWHEAWSDSLGKLGHAFEAGNVQAPGVDLTKARLGGAVLVEANFTAAVLLGVDFAQARLCGANFERADLGESRFMKADAQECNFHGANLQSAWLLRADFHDSDFRFCDLRNADLRGADLSGADLRGADLRGALVAHTTFEGAKMAGAKLRGLIGAEQIRCEHVWMEEQVLLSGAGAIRKRFASGPVESVGS